MYQQVRQEVVEITIFLRVDKDNTVELSIYDNGSDMSGDAMPERKNDLGITLIDILSHQLKGDYSFDGKQGVRFTIRFQRNVI